MTQIKMLWLWPNVMRCGWSNNKKRKNLPTLQTDGAYLSMLPYYEFPVWLMCTSNFQYSYWLRCYCPIDESFNKRIDSFYKHRWTVQAHYFTTPYGFWVIRIPFTRTSSVPSSYLVYVDWLTRAIASSKYLRPWRDPLCEKNGIWSRAHGEPRNSNTTEIWRLCVPSVNLWWCRLSNAHHPNRFDIRVPMLTMWSWSLFPRISRIGFR